MVSVEAMRQILARDPKSRILACAPSNSAADLLADRLRQQGIAPSEMFRLNAATRLVSALPGTLKTYARISDNAFVIPPVGDLGKFRVVVATCISASLPYALGIERGHFSHVFIDEAGQALEPEAMIAIRTMAGVNTNVVLSGDPQQLGPIVRSRIAERLGLATSYLDRLMNRDIYNLDTGKGITLGNYVTIVSATYSLVYLFAASSSSPKTSGAIRRSSLIRMICSIKGICRFGQIQWLSTVSLGGVDL